MKEINPSQTKRAAAFELWMNAPMPIVTLFKTLEARDFLDKLQNEIRNLKID